MPCLLLADDDYEFSALLERYFRTEGFGVEAAHDGEKALQMALTRDYDLIVLDIMMPGLDGLEVLRRLRERKRTPVLMLTALGEDSDSIAGFEQGADDYLGKPCNLKVLLARVKALLRRADGTDSDPAPAQGRVEAGDVILNPRSRTVHRGHTAIDLTTTEFALLEVLLRSGGAVVNKADLSERVLHRALGRFDRSLDMHVSNLRQKIGPLPDGRERIRTVRGIGYQYLIE